MAEQDTAGLRTAEHGTRVAVRCDVGGAAGLGRLVRCLAVAEELAARGVEVVFVCAAQAQPWAQMQLQARGLEVVEPPDGADGHVTVLDQVGADAVVFDCGGLPAAVYAAVRKTGRPTLAIVDGDLDGAEADVVVDHDLGAEKSRVRAGAGTTVLAGPDYALLRNDVLANRPISPPQPGPVDVPDVPSVVAVFDDTDVDAAAPAVARLLAETRRPFDATFVVPREADGTCRAVESVRTSERQRITVAAPSYRLTQRLSRADVVLTGAGATAWEMLCLGAAVGLVWVREEQVPTYRRMMVRRAVVGLGSVDGLGDDPAAGADKAARLLTDARERARLAETGWRMVDGLGRARVVDALLGLL